MNGFDEEKYYELLQNIPSVTNRSELQKALHRIKRERQHKNRIFYKLITTAIICLALVGTIRYSTTVAYTIAQIPGMKPLVDMIALDKGIEDIIANEYYEELGISQTVNGNTLTITGIVADESGMIIYYKLQSKDDLSYVQGSPKVEVYQNGQSLSNVIIGANWFAHEKGTFEIENSIELTSSNMINYGTRQFELQFSVPNQLETIFEIPFTLQNEIKPSKHIVVNEQLTIDNQKFTVHELILSPIRSQLKLSIDPTNTMEILHFSDIRLYNEEGEQWGKIENGVVEIGSIEDEKFSIMLESNYFRIPESFEIVFEEIEAIPKKDAFITIDWENKEIIQQPNNLLVELQINDDYEIVYTLSNYEKNEYKGVFGKMIDANGNVYLPNSMWISNHEKGKQVGQSYDVVMPPVNPVQLKVTRYERYLKDKARIEVNVK